jgi:hypothetical protein
MIKLCFREVRLETLKVETHMIEKDKKEEELDRLYF